MLQDSTEDALICWWSSGGFEEKEATSISVAHRRPRATNGTRVGIMLFERIWTGGKGERGYWGEEGQRVMDPTLIHRFHALGLVVSPLLSSCLCCRFSEGTQHYGGGRKLSYSIVLLSSLRDKIKTQREKKRTYRLLLKIPNFTFPENHFFDQSTLWPEFQSRFIIPRKLCCY